jgi:hypothetical protein
MRPQPIATSQQRENNNQNRQSQEDEPKLERIHRARQVREDETLKIGHTARDTISRQRTSTNQFEIAIKDESRF